MPVTSDAIVIPCVARAIRDGYTAEEIDAWSSKVHDTAALGRSVASIARKTVAGILAGLTSSSYVGYMLQWGNASLSLSFFFFYL